jgi:hypothetical protein
MQPDEIVEPSPLDSALVAFVAFSVKRFYTKKVLDCKKNRHARRQKKNRGAKPLPFMLSKNYQ